MQSRRTLKTKILGGMFFALLLAMSGTVWAKPVPNHNRQRMMEKIETIKMWKLMEALNLDSETALKVFPIIKEMDRKRAELMQEKRTLTRKIRNLVNARNGKAVKIDILASKLFDLNERIAALAREEYKKLKSVFSERQMGQYLLFQQQFRRELIRRWFRKKQGGAPRIPGEKNMRREQKVPLHQN